MSETISLRYSMVQTQIRGEVATIQMIQAQVRGETQELGSS